MKPYQIQCRIVGDLYEIQSIDYNYRRFVSESGDFPATRMTDLGSLFNDTFYQLRNLTPKMRNFYNRATLGAVKIDSLSLEERNRRHGDTRELSSLDFVTTVSSEADVPNDDITMQVLAFDHRHFYGLGHQWSLSGAINALTPLGVHCGTVSLEQILEDDRERTRELLTGYAANACSDRVYDYETVSRTVEVIEYVLAFVAANFPQGMATKERAVGIRHILQGGRVTLVTGY